MNEQKASEWVVKGAPTPGQRPVAVHRTGCRPETNRIRTVAAGEARRLLTMDAGLACQICRPDAALKLP
ncbi:DUF6233 domain-containing protein [Streptomyces sp. SID8016]|uniref:DUF6233 domain-containing protein n=1 Tax=Streptomyces sp. SID8016 TaxID=2706098 RepID=UPI0013D9E2A1|nr:hypothetical protein [Streptomyces sp. SID8016]